MAEKQIVLKIRGAQDVLQAGMREDEAGAALWSLNCRRARAVEVGASTMTVDPKSGQFVLRGPVDDLLYWAGFVDSENPVVTDIP